METPDEFLSLADLLRRERQTIVPPPRGDAVEEVSEDADCLEADAARDVRLFRARLGEALESALAVLRCDIATEVVGRELQLAPAAIEKIVQRALRRFAAERTIRVRVHPEDATPLCEQDVETITDDQLRRGDAILEYNDGTIDLSLGVRLDAVLRACK